MSKGYEGDGEGEREKERQSKERKGKIEESEIEFLESQKAGRKKESRKGEQDKELKLLFWNAKIWNKDKEFWDYIKGFDFISVCETWVEEKSWKNLKGRLPTTHNWICSFARKEKKRGRTKGGFIIGII